MTHDSWIVETGSEVQPLYLLQAYKGMLSSWSRKRGLAREFTDEAKAIHVCRELNQRGGPYGLARLKRFQIETRPAEAA
jgi:hypothetical protein